MSVTLVQQVAAKLTSGGSATKTVTVSTPAAGNTVLLAVRRDLSSGVTISSVSGLGVSGNWNLTGTVTGTDNVSAVDLYEGVNCSGSGTTISVVVSNTYGNVEVNASEWSGLGAALTADPAPAANTGTSATVTTATATPTAGRNVLLIAVGSVNSTLTDTPSGGFTALTRSATATHTGFAYQIVSSASGGYSTTWPSAVNYRPWAAVVAGYDAAGGGGGSTVGADAMHHYLRNVAAGVA